MLFERRFAKGIADGTQTVTFRRWKRPQAVAGNTYRTAVGRLVVESVAVVGTDTIDDADARRAGYESAAALLADLRGEPGLPVYRVQFHLAEGTDPRDDLASRDHLDPAEVASIRSRLERLDRASASGPWTATTLCLVRENPALRAADLAPRLGMDLLPFKLNVRKLKNLGLTVSLETGYRLSPRGEAYLRHVAE